MPSRFLCPKATGWSLPAACNDHNRSSPECFPHSGDVFLIREKPSRLAGLFMERVTSLRRLVPLALLWLHCRPAGNARQSTGLSDSIVRASSPAKKPSRLAGLFMERVTSLRRLVPLALLWLHCRPAGNARQSTGLSDSFVRALSPAKKPSRLAGLFMERVTRLELATSTLARWRSTG